MKRIAIIVSVSSKYSDISDVFFKLLDKNFQECPFSIIVNYNDGFIYKDYGYISYVNENNNSLTYSIVDIARKFDYDYYICLLADALIINKIKYQQICDFFAKIEENKVQYCRICNVSKKDKTIKRINKKNVWDVTFVAFVATKHFIIDTLSKYKSDLEFEEHYVKISNNIRKDEYYDDMYEDGTNCFQIIHAVKSGYWIKNARQKVIDNGIDINNHRDVMPRMEVLFWRIKQKARKYIKGNARIMIKKIFTLFGFKFATKQ